MQHTNHGNSRAESHSMNRHLFDWIYEITKYFNDLNHDVYDLNFEYYNGRLNCINPGNRHCIGTISLFDRSGEQNIDISTLPMKITRYNYNSEFKTVEMDFIIYE